MPLCITPTSSSVYWTNTTASTTACWLEASNTATTCSTNIRQVRWWYQTEMPIMWGEDVTTQYRGLIFHNNDLQTWGRPPHTPVLTEQEQAAQVVYAAARRQEKEDAGERARALLLSHLTPEQRAAFETNKWFVVEGGKSKRKYMIHAKPSLVANVSALKADDKVDHRLCAHCGHNQRLPMEDQLLLQKLMLEIDEDKFLLIARKHSA